MMDNKEIEKYLEKHGATKEDFEKFNLSYEDMKKILADEKEYIGEKLSIADKRNNMIKENEKIKINTELVKEIANEIEEEIKEE